MLAGVMHASLVTSGTICWRCFLPPPPPTLARVSWCLPVFRFQGCPCTCCPPSACLMLQLCLGCLLPRAPILELITDLYRRWLLRLLAPPSTPPQNRGPAVDGSEHGHQKDMGRKGVMSVGVLAERLGLDHERVIVTQTLDGGQRMDDAAGGNVADVMDVFAHLLPASTGPRRPA